MNDHFIAFNEAKCLANELGRDEFVFRGKTYSKGEWTNGIPVWRCDEYRGSKKKRKKRKSKKSKKSKKSSKKRSRR